MVLIEAFADLLDIIVLLDLLLNEFNIVLKQAFLHCLVFNTLLLCFSGLILLDLGLKP